MTLPAENHQPIPLQRSLAQNRAEFAFRAVEHVDHELFDKYKQLARSAPADVQTNGLAQTLAYWKAKGEREHTDLLADITRWLRSQIHFSNDQDALNWIVLSASNEEYRRATAETIALLTWIKRFAEGF